MWSPTYSIDRFLNSISKSGRAALIEQGAFEHYMNELQNLTKYRDIIYSPVLFKDIYQADLVTALTTAATGHIGLNAGTVGTNAPHLDTIDSEGDMEDAVARFTWHVPSAFDSDNVSLQLGVLGSLTTEPTESGTIDIEVYRPDTVSGSGEGLAPYNSTGPVYDYCLTDAQDLNVGTCTWSWFTIATALADGSVPLTPGELLDVKMTISINDSVGSGEVSGQISAVCFKMIPYDLS